jgi:hypothetical protein
MAGDNEAVAHQKETVEKAQTVSLRGVIGADVGMVVRRSNLDLPAPDAGAQIASSSLPFLSPIHPDSSQ